MNKKIRSEEIYEAYQKALDEKFNPIEKIYLSAPKYVLLNRGWFYSEASGVASSGNPLS